jgi:UDP-N-acetylglucosamine transferase subunit ALG13
MIFVSFGNVPIPFTRLALKIDEIAGVWQENFIVQHGYTEYHFLNAESVKFLSGSEMMQLIENASVVITHGGYGTISECVKKGKPVIAVPRVAGEHNHSQEELVKALEKDGYILATYNTNDLREKILEASYFVPRLGPKNNVAEVINSFISSVALKKDET